MSIYLILNFLLHIFLYTSIFFLTLGVCIEIFLLCDYFFYRTIKNTFSLSPYPRITIQLPTYNELAVINCAQCCLHFDYPNDKYNIVIGDDSDNPEISRKLAGFAKNQDKIIIVSRNTNKDSN